MLVHAGLHSAKPQQLLYQVGRYRPVPIHRACWLPNRQALLDEWLKLPDGARSCCPRNTGELSSLRFTVKQWLVWTEISGISGILELVLCLCAVTHPSGSGSSVWCAFCLKTWLSHHEWAMLGDRLQQQAVAISQVSKLRHREAGEQPWNGWVEKHISQALWPAFCLKTPKDRGNLLPFFFTLIPQQTGLCLFPETQKHRLHSRTPFTCPAFLATAGNQPHELTAPQTGAQYDGVPQLCLLPGLEMQPFCTRPASAAGSGSSFQQWPPNAFHT